ncbi:MAG: tail fiber domain-containing protein [Phycisphaerales bacterium]|nr:tail fiber domain-containing protein [Phycisphaerales bacterium]
MTRTTTIIIAALATAVAGIGLAGRARAGGPSGTTFTYQGELSSAGAPADGAFDLSFSLWDTSTGGAQVGGSLLMADMPVSGGVFSVELDFGAAAFDGTARWLEIAVEGTTLSPRQMVTGAPYSIQTRGIVVDEDLNVGIGTTRSGASLSVAGPVLSDGPSGGAFVTRNPNNQTASFTLGWLDDVARLRIGGNGAGASGGLDIQRTGDISLLRILHNGHVGIGTTDPEARLEVHASQTAIRGYGSTGVYGQADTSQGEGVWGHASHPSGGTNGVFGSASSTSGVGVYGRAWAGSGLCHGVLGQTGSTHGYGVFGFAPNRFGPNFGVRGETLSSEGTGVFGYANVYDGVNYGVRGSSNSFSGYDFYASGVGINYGAPSSIRWKRNISPVTDPLDKLARIRGVYYDWDDEHGGGHDIGFIGEEVGRVVPEIVAFEDGGAFVTGMDYGRMTPLLVEAVNALRAEKDAEIDALRADRDALLARMQVLEELVAGLAATATEETR